MAVEPSGWSIATLSDGADRTQILAMGDDGRGTWRQMIMFERISAEKDTLLREVRDAHILIEAVAEQLKHMDGSPAQLEALDSTTRAMGVSDSVVAAAGEVGVDPAGVGCAGVDPAGWAQPARTAASSGTIAYGCLILMSPPTSTPRSGFPVCRAQRRPGSELPRRR